MNVVRIAIAIAIVRFVHTAPIYADVFSIFYHSLQLSRGRNNKRCRERIMKFVQFQDIAVALSILLIYTTYGG